MDLYLRCNSLTCRTSLKDRAVVTTCSHIFCLQCAETLGLSRPGGERHCPACSMSLINPDDPALTVLRPTEDYKTSVLSGLDPDTIMECTGRALQFWAYQMSQEIVYQEVRLKSLADKYTNLNTQLDKVVHNASKEISSLQSRLVDMQAAQEQLRKENQELADMYREKCKKFTQITHLYNVPKSQAMGSQMQTAAASQAISYIEAQAHHNIPGDLAIQSLRVSAPPQTSPGYQQRLYPVDLEGVEELHRHQRSGTGSSKGAKQNDALAIPPPNRPVVRLRRGEPPNATPQHRARLAGPSRPSTGLSQLPNDSTMLERFQAN
ncbi:hypothetical protein BDV10DRAFT_196193 [Aspergillus recurvatus]